MTITLPDGATDRERRRVQQEAERVRRNAQIREAYPALREKHGWREAMQVLADRHNCSSSTVRAVVRGQA